MRRALLLATLLAAPALASAQLTPGTMSFTNTDADPMAKTINLVECRSGTARVEISWQPSQTPPATSVTYQLYAANKDTAQTANFAGVTNDVCPTEAQSNTNTNTTVVKVGDPLTNPGTLVNRPFSTSAMAAALVAGAIADPCAGSGNTAIYLCMQGQSGGANFGAARATITLALTRPDGTPELLLPVSPGDGALTPRWSDTATNATWYQVQAISLADPTSVPTAGDFDPAGGFAGFNPADPARHTSGFVTGSQLRLGGLRNGVTYAVMVTGFTADFNASDPSNVATGAPQVTTDFWSTYKAAGGQEAGGCSSGLAGPVGLLVLAGTLAVLRRRK